MQAGGDRVAPEDDKNDLVGKFVSTEVVCFGLHRISHVYPYSVFI